MWDSRSAALHAMTTAVVACMLLLHLPNTSRAADAPVRLPDELQQTIAASRDAWRTQRRSTKSLPQVAEHVYEWIEAAAPKSSVAAVVDALAKVMIVRGEETNTGWTQR